MCSKIRLICVPSVMNALRRICPPHSGHSSGKPRIRGLSTRPKANAPVNPWLVPQAQAWVAARCPGAPNQERTPPWRFGSVWVSVSPWPSPPPNTPTPSPAQPTAANRGVSNPALPYALREIAARFPVTLYTGVDCSPCNTGRALLQERQVPFTERTISSEQDSSALQQLSGDTTLPLLSIGRQQIKGVSDGEWKQNLDAAG